jgi:hypothetical protein
MPDWLKSIVAPFFGIESTELPEITAVESYRDASSKYKETKNLAKYKQRQLDSGDIIDSERQQVEQNIDSLIQRMIELDKVKSDFGSENTKRGEERVQKEIDRVEKLKQQFESGPKEPTPKLINGRLVWPEEKVDDNEEKGEVQIFNGKSIKTTNKEDVTLSAKPNGFLDKGLKNLYDVMARVDSKLLVLIESQKQSSVIVNNSTVNKSENSNNKEYLMSPVRDSNWINRMNYYSASNQLKAV